MIHDATRCLLGEGPLWHPERDQLFWFDILDRALLTREGDETRRTRFDDIVSAAGWIDRDRLLIASSRALFVHDLGAGTNEEVCALEADNPATRSNDGRADPWGGFWIGTMGLEAQKGAAAIYRYYKGEVRPLFRDLTITNAICFAPDAPLGYFTDTPSRKIMRVRLDETDGWPQGDPEVWLDLSGQAHSPDGAVTDADGNLWCALWGGGRVACFSPTGAHLRDVSFEADQTTCPAFGGPDLSTLFCTSAAVGLSETQIIERRDSGRTLAEPGAGKGHAEHRVIL